MTKLEVIGYGKRGPIFKIRGAADEDPIERLEARQRQLAEDLEALDAEIGTEVRSADQKSKWTKIEDEMAKNDEQLELLRSETKDREARAERVAAARSKWAGTQVKASTDKQELFRFNMMDAYSSDEKVHDGLVSRSLKILDDKKTQRHLNNDQERQVERLLRTKDADTDGQLISAYLIATSNPAYRSAFQKATGSLHPVFSPDEGRAVEQVQAIQRAMSVGTQAAGGFAVPVIIDPTIIKTAQGSENDILRLARVETITNDRWRGLTSAGVTWKFDGEATPSTDNSPTIARPEVPVYRADGFIPYSIEIGQDWPSFAENMSAMLGDGYDELLADKLTNGTGSNTPTGIVSRLVAQTSPDVSVATATAGTLAASDIYAMWARLPQRHRRKSSTAWMSSTDVQNAIRQLGTVDPNFTVDITNEAIPRMFGREYPMNDYMSSVAAGTAAANLLIVGDWKGYLVAQRAGMNIEFVPMLFDVTNNRPTGQRGWFAYARVGADVVDPTAFQLLQNKTS